MALLSSLPKSMSDRFMVTVATTSLLLCSYCIIVVVFNLFFHPLRKFPGPLLGRVSGAWARIHNFHGRKAHKIHEAHLRYGPIVRVGPNLLSFADPSALRDIYTSKVFVKEKVFYRAKRIFQEEHLLSFTDPEAHSERRKLLSRGFSQAAMRDFEPKVAAKINILLEQWASIASAGSSVDIYRWVHMLGFDTVSNYYVDHLMFDIDPGTVATGVESDVMQYMRAWKPTYIYKEFLPQLQTWGVYVPGYIGNYFRQVQKWKIMAVEIVRSCRANGTKTAFLSRVLDDENRKSPTSLTDSILAEECMSGMFGGSGTTANTFVYLVWAVIRQPGIVRKLQKELDEYFPGDTVTPDYLTCNTMPYLNAVIHETMRLYPATIAMLPRTATADTIVSNVHIPKGTNVGTQNYTTHRCGNVFPEPETFKPERWLVNDPTPLKEAFTPFSIGPRKCIGLNLAEMELRILTAAFFLKFDVSLDSVMTDADMIQYDTFNAAPIGGKLLVHLKSRAE